MSDVAQVYPSGKEKAIGGQTGGLPYPAGKELAQNGNGDKGHDYHDDRTK